MIMEICMTIVLALATCVGLGLTINIILDTDVDRGRFFFAGLILCLTLLFPAITAAMWLS